MIDAGLGVCLATDYNPGSTPSGKMSFVLSLACIKMKMLPVEAIQAATIDGACAIEMDQTLGSITRGKMANLILTKAIPSLDFIPYAFGSDAIDKVLIKGRIFEGL
jgi:imidazolonepropionase